MSIILNTYLPPQHLSGILYLVLGTPVDGSAAESDQVPQVPLAIDDITAVAASRAVRTMTKHSNVPAQLCPSRKLLCNMHLT